MIKQKAMLSSATTVVIEGVNASVVCEELRSRFPSEQSRFVILDRSYANMQAQFVFRLTRGESKDSDGIPIDVTHMRPTDTAALILAVIESQCMQ